MRTITTKTDAYKFDELSESAKDTAVSQFYDVNTDHDWWEYCFDDAANIGLKIESYGDRAGCTGDFTEDVSTVCDKIMTSHGKSCDTYKTIQEFYRRRHDGNSMDEKELLGLLLEDYRVMLDREYEYLTSEESIIETIQANDYEFTESGKLI